jgi:hypothetical protein
MTRDLLLSVGLLALTLAARADDPPQAEIANGAVRARVYLPDPVDGYYRATRFDWSGVVSSLEWNGHSYFGQWFARYDPKINDAIMGPVEEFQTAVFRIDRAKGTLIGLGQTPARV